MEKSAEKWGPGGPGGNAPGGGGEGGRGAKPLKLKLNCEAF